MVANWWMRFLVVALVLALPSGARAQEAVLSGVVTDSTGGVLPGVAITAVHVASGNTFDSVTDARGEYRLPARAGDYRITAALDGFATVTQELQLLVGQVARTTFELVPSALQETVTVTGDAPLISVTQSTLSANIDRRQMESLPVNGRNWMGLALLAPGSKATETGGSPIGSERDAGMFQIVLDGQEITQMVSTPTGLGQTSVSRDAVQEFEFISSRFDAEHGHSGGLIIKAITKSGTNEFAGTLSGYFRHDNFNAADFVTQKVLPYSNQQIVGTFGGPIRRDRAHFFAYYEHEHEPQTWAYTNAWPSFNRDYSGANTRRNGGGRFDLQFSSDTRLMARGNFERNFYPVSPGFPFLAWHPTLANFERNFSRSVYGTLTHVLDARTVNEISGGYHYFDYRTDAVFAENFPSIALRGLYIGKWRSIPRDYDQQNFSVRNNFTAYRSGAGTHDLSVGGEFTRMTVVGGSCNSCDGVIWANAGPVPANIESLFPVFDDLSTWNLAALSPITSRYVVGIGERLWTLPPRKSAGFWIQDDWKPINALTLNLGLRSDFCTGCYTDHLELPPLTLLETREIQKWTVSPRLGFAYALPNNRTVIRGGGGRFYFGQTEHVGLTSANNITSVAVEVPNDGRPNFAADPWNVEGGGRAPTTVEEALALGVQRTYGTWIMGPDARVPYMWQSSLGFQHELATGLAVQADYVRSDGRALPTRANRNLTCNPATGANYPYTDISKRAYPEWGVLPYVFYDGKSESHALQTAITKRFSQAWQMSGTYTLSKEYDNTPRNGFGSPPDNVCDWDAEWALAEGEQRHRVVLNGIWTLPAGFEVSGLYFYHSGQRFKNDYGGDLRNTGSQSSGRLRPDGTILPRNSFVGDPIHRVDMRIARRFALRGGVTVDGIFEVFNVFNHANYGAYVLSESNPRYGQPVQDTNVAYAPRMLQLGFKVAF